MLVKKNINKKVSIIKLKKKNNFVLPNYTGRIFLRATYSNVILTLTDLENKVIICRTSGSSGILGSKRKKCVPQVVEVIFKAILPYIRLYDLKNIEIVLKMRIKSYFYILLKELEHNSLSVCGYIIRRRVAFNGVRKRKLRRT